jgi:hypothetical protein
VEYIVTLVTLEVWTKSRGAANPPLLDDESDDLCSKWGESDVIGGWGKGDEISRLGMGASFGELDLALCDPLGGSAVR